MNDVNNYTVSGRLIKPPELRRTPTGIPVCDLYLATNKTQNKKESNEQITTIIPITLWNKTAEYWGEKLQRSDHILVVGELVNESNKNKKNINSKLKMYNPQVTLLQHTKPKRSNKDTIVVPFV